jgi:hypothetical protein
MGGSENAVAASCRVRGACYAFYAFEIGLSIDLDRAAQSILTAQTRKRIRHTRKSPPYFEHEPAPIVVTQECEPVPLSAAVSEPRIEATVYDFAAISVVYRFPMEMTLESAARLSEELYDNPGLEQHARRMVASLLETIRPAVSKPKIADFFEDYTIFHIAEVDGAAARPEFIEAHRGTWAGLLRAESSPLSRDETDDALQRRISYGVSDALVVDWNAALVLDTDIQDVRPVLEYANVALLELRYVDQELDRALDQAYDLFSRPRNRWLPRFHHKELRRIAGLQMDNALLFESVDNALKLVGDQHLARVYRLAAERMHLPDWDASIMRKLQTLESIYEKLSGLAGHQRMEVLEWIIIVLIALSILLELI